MSAREEILLEGPHVSLELLGGILDRMVCTAVKSVSQHQGEMHHEYMPCEKL